MMQRQHSRAIVIVVAAMVLVGVGSAVARRLENQYTVQNQTGQVLTEIQVDICNKVHTLKNVPPRAAVSVPYAITCDSNYRIRCTLPDGATITGNGGYVTTGYFGRRDQIIVKPNRKVVVIESSEWP